MHKLHLGNELYLAKRPSLRKAQTCNWCTTFSLGYVLWLPVFAMQNLIAYMKAKTGKDCIFASSVIYRFSTSVLAILFNKTDSEFFFGFHFFDKETNFLSVKYFS